MAQRGCEEQRGGGREHPRSGGPSWKGVAAGVEDVGGWAGGPHTGEILPAEISIVAWMVLSGRISAVRRGVSCREHSCRSPKDLPRHIVM